MKNSPSVKASAGEIPVKILKKSKFCFSELKYCINECLANNKLQDISKLSDITPVFKNFNPSDKASYELLLVSKVFEKIIYDQLYE